MDDGTNSGSVDGSGPTGRHAAQAAEVLPEDVEAEDDDEEEVDEEEDDEVDAGVVVPESFDAVDDVSDFAAAASDDAVDEPEEPFPRESVR